MRKVVVYIAMSLDGYIAAENDNIEFLDLVALTGEDYGYGNFIATIDTVIMGRKTYDKVLGFGIEFPHKSKECFVISRTKFGKDENVEFYNDDLQTLISDLKLQSGKNIFIDGGAEIINNLAKLNLIDDYVISIIPTFVGNGVKLFNNGRPSQVLKLINSMSFKSGLVQLHYLKS